MYRKVQFLFALDPRHSIDLLEARLEAEGERLRGVLPAGTRLLHGVRLADDPTRQTAHAAELAEHPDTFDAVVEVGGEGAEWPVLTRAASGMIANLAGFVVLRRSAVIAGTEHVIVPGEHPLILVYALRRLPSLSVPQFHDYWLNTHAELARGIPGINPYRQFHADGPATLQAARELGLGIADFEGAAHGYYPDIQAFLQIMSQPEVVADAIEDEKRFIDIPRSALGLYRIGA